MNTALPLRRRDDAWEARCPLCRQWTGLDEGWSARYGLSRCRACWRLYFAAKERGYNTNEYRHACRLEAQRTRYWANHEGHLTAARRWRAANADRVHAYNRAYRAAHHDELLVKARDYYAEAREVILLKKRRAA